MKRKKKTKRNNQVVNNNTINYNSTNNFYSTGKPDRMNKFNQVLKFFGLILNLIPKIFSIWSVF